MKRPKSAKMPRQVVRKMLSDPACVLDNDAPGSIRHHLYRLPDGSVLVAISKNHSGVRYESRDEFLAWYEHLEERARRGPTTLKTLLPEQQEFVARVPNLVRRLADYLRIPLENLDMRRACVPSIER
jgi:hypothetical protein